MKLEGKVATGTGGTAGIGEALSRLFAQQDAQVASATRLRHVAYRPAHRTSLSAVLSLRRSIAVDYAADQMCGNCLFTITADTLSLDEHIGDSASVQKRFIARQQLPHRPGPEEIAQAALYLSDAPTLVKGASFQIGGRSL
jgi:NAD(P)-dependent dehydrogenase (short-subunit alcohol dehydrogenase family)